MSGCEIQWWYRYTQVLNALDYKLQKFLQLISVHKVTTQLSDRLLCSKAPFT